MKRLLDLILLTVLIVSCSRETQVVEEKYPDGKPKRVCIYTGRGDNKQMIRETTYYSNGKMQMEGTFKNSKRDGKWSYWYENGSKWSEGFFKDGKNDSIRITYFESGKIRYEAYYKDGTRAGKWRFFDEAGRLLREIDYSAPDSAAKSKGDS